MTQKLLEYLRVHVEAMVEVGIKEITLTGFIAKGVDGKKKEFEKEFEMKPDTKYVIYKKVGWEVMGCCKPWEQFANECDLIGQSLD